MAKKRRWKKKAAIGSGILLTSIVGIHAFFGARPSDLAHELAVYSSRVMDKEQTINYPTANTTRHPITLLGETTSDQRKKLEDMIATLPYRVVKHTDRIRFVDSDHLEESVSAHAHLLYNSGTLCIKKDASVDTWVHEFYHPAFFSVPVKDQLAFSSIGEDLYRQRLIPFASHPDRWEGKENLPAGQSGPAFGFPSRYAAKHPYECVSEMCSEIWRYTHPKLHTKDVKSTYSTIFSDPSTHKIADHRARYEVLKRNGFFTPDMISLMDASFNPQENLAQRTTD